MKPAPKGGRKAISPEQAPEDAKRQVGKATQIATRHIVCSLSPCMVGMVHECRFFTVF
jgi:hypothetical protein